MIRPTRALFGVLLLVLGSAGAINGQNPPPAGQPGQRGGGGGQGRRSGPVVMTLSTTGWPDGGPIALRYTQAGEEVSPPLVWSDPPAEVVSFVLIVQDLDVVSGDGVNNALHWMVWNIPAAARGLKEAVPQGPALPDGSKQISMSGPYYRGPAAPASGPAHHYMFELFALDSAIDVAPVGATPANTRAAVVAAMAGHVRGKATLTGLFKRAS